MVIRKTYFFALGAARYGRKSKAAPTAAPRSQPCMLFRSLDKLRTCGAFASQVRTSGIAFHLMRRREDRLHPFTYLSLIGVT